MISRKTHEFIELMNCLDLPLDLKASLKVLHNINSIDLELSEDEDKFKLVIIHNADAKFDYELAINNTERIRVLRYAVKRFNTLN